MPRKDASALGHGTATIVGQSLGGGIAMQFAYQFPERCERLVMVSSGGLGREVHTLLRALSVPGIERLFPVLCSSSLRDAAQRLAAWFGRDLFQVTPTLEEVWRAYCGLVDDNARAAFFRTLRSVVDAGGQSVSANDRLYLAGLVPTLIVWGGREALIPVAHGHAAHAAIAGSRLEIFEDAGHFPHCESPSRFVDTLIRFIDATKPPPAPELTWIELPRQTTTVPTKGEPSWPNHDTSGADDPRRVRAGAADQRPRSPAVLEPPGRHRGRHLSRALSRVVISTRAARRRWRA